MLALLVKPPVYVACTAATKQLYVVYTAATKYVVCTAAVKDSDYIRPHTHDRCWALGSADAYNPSTAAIQKMALPRTAACICCRVDSRFILSNLHEVRGNIQRTPLAGAASACAMPELHAQPLLAMQRSGESISAPRHKLTAAIRNAAALHAMQSLAPSDDSFSCLVLEPTRHGAQRGNQLSENAKTGTLSMCHRRAAPWARRVCKSMIHVWAGAVRAGTSPPAPRTTKVIALLHPSASTAGPAAPEAR